MVQPLVFEVTSVWLDHRAGVANEIITYIFRTMLSNRIGANAPKKILGSTMRRSFGWPDSNWVLIVTKSVSKSA